MVPLEPPGVHGLAPDAVAEEPHTAIQVLGEATAGNSNRIVCRKAASAHLASLYGKRAPRTPLCFRFSWSTAVVLNLGCVLALPEGHLTLPGPLRPKPIEWVTGRPGMGCVVCAFVVVVNPHTRIFFH